MSLFRFANAEEVTRYTTEDGQDWIEFRSELRKDEVNKLLGRAPTGDRDIEGGLEFLEHFFRIATVRWSMVDDGGNAVAPTVEVYRALEARGARQIDEWIGQHMRKTVGTEVEEMEGESLS